jgi:DNA-directed RNA polymerase specialized sigma24 family protein
MGNEPTDAYRSALARRALAGDRSALQEYLRALTARLADKRHFREGFRFLEGQDLKQELYLRLYQEIGKHKDRSAYNSWVSKTAKNLAKDLHGYPGANAVVKFDEGPELVTRAALAETFRQLTSKQQIAFALWSQGASSGDIAEELGISRSQAYRIVTKIQKVIVEQMERVQTADPDSLLEMAVGSTEFESSFDEGLAEIAEIRARMQQAQLEIDGQKETARNMIEELGFL